MGKRFNEMNDAEFDRLVESYIDKEATGYGEMPAEFFLDLLAERELDKAGETIILSIELDDSGNLVIIPDREMSDLLVRGNEIVTGNRRFVLHFRRE